jgi:SAM-dependent methyltransferase
MARLTEETKAWEDLGTMDPLWSILTEPDKKHGKWDIQEFFTTGEKEIDRLMNKSETLRRPLGRGIALDFGCGVGRLTRALAKHFEKCCGVDISSTMIEKAKELNSEISNCEFLLNKEENLSMFPTNHFDMIYTNIVLQHIANEEVIKSYVSEFVRVVKTGGLAVFQLPSYISPIYMLQPEARIYTVLSKAGFDGRLLYERLGLSPIRRNYVPEKEVIELLESLGADVLDCQRAPWPGPFRGISNTYFFTK